MLPSWMLLVSLLAGFVTSLLAWYLGVLTGAAMQRYLYRRNREG